jgi:hypothetical protein
MFVNSGSGAIQLSGSGNFPIVVLGSNTNGGVVGIADQTRLRAFMSIANDGRSQVSADVKAFSVSNPTQPGTEIVYACIEGPEAAVYIRGTGHLNKGEGTILLPSHFVSVANAETLTVQVTPLSADSLGLAVVSKHLDSILVKELSHGTGTYDFDWEV